MRASLFRENSQKIRNNPSKSESSTNFRFIIMFINTCLSSNMKMVYQYNNDHSTSSWYLPRKPGRVAQSVGHLTRKSGVLGSIPGLHGHILSFLLPLIQEGQLSVTGKSMCTKYWLTA